jgi:LIM domain-binding protein 1
VLQESDNLWWDAFATEFFEDEATLTLTFCLEDGPKRYSKYFFNRIVNALVFCCIIRDGFIWVESEREV